MPHNLSTSPSVYEELAILLGIIVFSLLVNFVSINILPDDGTQGKT
jgi:hypothetical protein